MKKLLLFKKLDLSLQVLGVMITVLALQMFDNELLFYYTIPASQIVSSVANIFFLKRKSRLPFRSLHLALMLLFVLVFLCQFQSFNTHAAFEHWLDDNIGKWLIASCLLLFIGLSATLEELIRAANIREASAKYIYSIVDLSIQFLGVSSGVFYVLGSGKDKLELIFIIPILSAYQVLSSLIYLRLFPSDRTRLNVLFCTGCVLVLAIPLLWFIFYWAPVLLGLNAWCIALSVQNITARNVDRSIKS